MEFLHEPGRIYRLDDTGRTIAEVLFPAQNDGTATVTHTFVDESLRGQGTAGELMKAAVEELRLQNKKARLTCSYAVKWFERHPEYRDVLAEQ